MKVVNLTQHPVLLLDNDRPDLYVQLDPQGRTARVNSEMRTDEWIEVDGVKVPIISFHNREVQNIPDPEEDVLYVTSGLVAALADRPDVVSPARLVRDPIFRNTRGARALLRG